MSKTMTGSRAIVKVGQGDAAEVVGVFDSCQYGGNVGTEAVHLLGRYSAAEISVLSYEAVQVACSGFRVVGNGVHVLPKAPKLQDLLNLETLQLTVEDRQTGEIIANVKECVPSSWSENQQAKANTRFNITYIGIVLSDEDGDQAESAGATNLP